MTPFEVRVKHRAVSPPPPKPPKRPVISTSSSDETSGDKIEIEISEGTSIS